MKKAEIFYGTEEEYKKKKLSDAIKAYYAGFNRSKPMFEEEVNDLKKIYEDHLEKIEVEMQDYMSTYMYYMKKMVELNDNKEAIEEKLAKIEEKEE